MTDSNERYPEDKADTLRERLEYELKSHQGYGICGIFPDRMGLSSILPETQGIMVGPGRG